MDPRDYAQEHRRQDYARQDYQRMDAARTARIFEARRARENAVFGPRRAGTPAQTDSATPEGRKQGGGLWGFLADAAMIAGSVYLDVLEERRPVEQAASELLAALGDGELAGLSDRERTALRIALLGQADATLAVLSKKARVNGAAATVTVVARCTPADSEAVDVTRVWEYERQTDGSWQLKTLPTPFLDPATSIPSHGR
jgi:hypothetical protein